MSQVNNLLSERLKKGEKSSKIAALAKQSADGQLTSFAGIFNITALNEHETHSLKSLLEEYTDGRQDVEEDFKTLTAITSEVKAISNQAALLHGERIKKAQAILIAYKEGAFTAWLMATYGNRQTPYNFLQYHEFVEAMPRLLKPQIDAMPRQAIYTLASREGDIEKKQAIIENYQGQTKDQILQIIRETFPLETQDRRRENLGEKTIQTLSRAVAWLGKARGKLNKSQKAMINELLDTLQDLAQNS